MRPPPKRKDVVSTPERNARNPLQGRRGVSFVSAVLLPGADAWAASADTVVQQNAAYPLFRPRLARPYDSRRERQKGIMRTRVKSSPHFFIKDCFGIRFLFDRLLKFKSL